MNNNYVYYKTFTKPDEYGQRMVVSNYKGFVFDSNYKLTKETIETLPEWYVECFNNEIGGYVCTAGIKSMTYIPSENKSSINNLKGDKLYISYKYNNVGTRNFDVVVFGNEILPVLAGAVKYSNYDIDEILSEMFNSEKVKTSEKFMKIWECLYSRLEQYESDKVFISYSASRKLKNFEDTEYEYYDFPCSADEYAEYLKNHPDSETDESIWQMIDAW